MYIYKKNTWGNYTAETHHGHDKNDLHSLCKVDSQLIQMSFQQEVLPNTQKSFGRQAIGLKKDHFTTTLILA